jgi:hypothetical protein
VRIKISLFKFNLKLKLFFSDLVGLQQYKRRSPYDEFGQEELITVYLRSDVEKKAFVVWKSIENLNKEKEKRRHEIDERRRYLFNLKKTLRVYKDRIEQLESPMAENTYVNLDNKNNNIL